MKVGTYDIPLFRLPTLIEETGKIYTKFQAEEITDLGLIAKLLDHKSSTSGAFRQKLADMRAYGLLEGRGGVKVSSLAKRLTYSDPLNPQDRVNAYKEAVLRIPLWKDFFSKWGTSIPKDQFWANLAKIAGLEAPQAQSVEEEVRSAYLTDIRDIPAQGTPTPMMAQQTDTQKQHEPTKDTETIHFGNIEVSLPKANMKEAWIKAKKMIDIYLDVDAPKKP
jgi:hypothetical protein